MYACIYVYIYVYVFKAIKLYLSASDHPYLRPNAKHNNNTSFDIVFGMKPFSYFAMETFSAHYEFRMRKS